MARSGMQREVTCEDRLEDVSCVRFSGGVLVIAATKEFGDTGFFPPVRDVLHDLPCRLSEAE